MPYKKKKKPLVLFRFKIVSKYLSIRFIEPLSKQQQHQKSML